MANKNRSRTERRRGVAATSPIVIDYAASLRRLEKIVTTLRQAYVSDGWSIDQAGAEKALAYLQSRAGGAPDDDGACAATIAFLDSHNQSLDWVFRGEPCMMICAAAAHSKRARSLSKLAV
jgi:hypothetical protein